RTYAGRASQTTMTLSPTPSTALSPGTELLPPILAGRQTPDMRRRVEQFFFSAASLFEAWVTRRKSAHTQRAYREDVMTFLKFAGINWPDQVIALYSVSVKDVLAFRQQLVARDAAPKTINWRTSSLS